jgi:PIN like domain
VPNRFPLFTDACLRQQIVDGLVRRGWDVERAVDAFPERTQDDVLFEHAAKADRVFVTNDERIPAIAEQWLAKQRYFRGLIIWKRRHHLRMTDGDIIRAIEALADKKNPFDYPVVYLKPQAGRR